MQDVATDLGPCCICGGGKARNILMLPYRSPTLGRGWGCAQCGLASDGAIAVLCDRCLGRYQRNNAELRRCCRGYPATDGRVPIADLPRGNFDHDRTKHPEVTDGAIG